MLLFYITCKDFEEASRIGQKLVEEKLIVCANSFPNINSCYLWEGVLENKNECAVFLKTIEANAKAVEKRVKELSSYSVPFISSFKVSVNTEYEKWLKQSVKAKK